MWCCINIWQKDFPIHATLLQWALVSSDLTFEFCAFHLLIRWQYSVLKCRQSVPVARDIRARVGITVAAFVLTSVPHFGRLWMPTWGLFLSPELCQEGNMEELVHHTFLFSLALSSWWQAPRVHSSWTFLPGSRFVEPIPRVLCVRHWPPFSHALLYIKGLSPSHWFYWSSVLSSCLTMVILYGKISMVLEHKSWQWHVCCRTCLSRC